MLILRPIIPDDLLEVPDRFTERDETCFWEEHPNAAVEVRSSSEMQTIRIGVTDLSGESVSGDIGLVSLGLGAAEEMANWILKEVRIIRALPNAFEPARFSRPSILPEDEDYP